MSKYLNLNISGIPFAITFNARKTKMKNMDANHF